MDIAGITSAIFELKPFKVITTGVHDLFTSGASIGTSASDSAENVLSTVNDISGVGTIVDISG